MRIISGPRKPSGRRRGLAHAFTLPKSGCPALLAFLARGRGFSQQPRHRKTCGHLCFWSRIGLLLVLNVDFGQARAGLNVSTEHLEVRTFF